MINLQYSILLGVQNIMCILTIAQTFIKLNIEIVIKLLILIYYNINYI